MRKKIVEIYENKLLFEECGDWREAHLFRS